MGLNLQDHSQLAPAPTSAPLSNISVPSLPALMHEHSSSWFYTTTLILLSLLALEQVVYRYKKRHLPGDSWTIPIIGKFADSMKPTLEGYQKQWNSGALSAVSVFNIFIVMASSNEYARKILNSPSFAEPCLVHSAKQILRSDSWVFLTGKSHIEYRRGLNHLFTRKALGIYIGVQDALTRKHFKRWLEEAAKDPSPKPIMMTARALNMDISLRVFCGPHIPDQGAREINEKYWHITRSLELVNFPFAFPGTKVYKATQSRKVALRWLEQAAHKSKIAMANGAEPECMLDEWVQLLSDPSYKGRREFSDLEMAMVLFSFLFASQDAMSSGLIYGFQHLADHPEILTKVRTEQERIRGGDFEKPLTLELLEQMPYLQAVVKESMRVKPPVTMVPYKVTKAFPITDDYTVPANSMVIPSFYNSLHDSSIYPDPDSFKPERWLDAEGSAANSPKNYLVFGSGPHRCIGLEYTNLTIALVLANASVMFNWEHVVTPLSNEVEIIATLFPKDGCRLKLTPRTTRVD